MRWQSDNASWLCKPGYEATFWLCWKVRANIFIGNISVYLNGYSSKLIRSVLYQYTAFLFNLIHLKPFPCCLHWSRIWSRIFDGRNPLVSLIYLAPQATHSGISPNHEFPWNLTEFFDYVHSLNWDSKMPQIVKKHNFNLNAFYSNRYLPKG